jgi:hypothetical protein
MANITLTGLFKDSLGAVDVGAVITFTHETTTGETLATTKSEIIVSPSGAYSITLEYGQIRIDYTTRFTERFIATVIVNSDTVATSLPELLNAAVPVTPAVILQMQAILADAVVAKDASVAAQIAAEAAAATTATRKDTFANLIALAPTTDGITFVCQERANAEYILQPAGYTALAGDATFANSRVGKLVNANTISNFNDSIDDAISYAKANGSKISLETREIASASAIDSEMYDYLENGFISRLNILYPVNIWGFSKSIILTQDQGSELNYNSWPQGKVYKQPHDLTSDGQSRLKVLLNRGTSHQSSDLTVWSMQSQDGFNTLSECMLESGRVDFPQGNTCWSAGTDGERQYFITRQRGNTYNIGATEHYLNYASNPDTNGGYVRKAISFDNGVEVPVLFHSFAKLGNGKLAFGYHYTNGEVGLAFTDSNSTVGDAYTKTIMFAAGSDLVEPSLLYDTDESATVGFLRTQNASTPPKFFVSLNNGGTFSFSDVTDIPSTAFIFSPINIAKANGNYYAFVAERTGEARMYLLIANASDAVANGFSAFKKYFVGNSRYSGSTSSGCGAGDIYADSRKVCLFYGEHGDTAQTVHVVKMDISFDKKSESSTQYDDRMHTSVLPREQKFDLTSFLESEWAADDSGEGVAVNGGGLFAYKRGSKLRLSGYLKTTDATAPIINLLQTLQPWSSHKPSGSYSDTTFVVQFLRGGLTAGTSGELKLLNATGALGKIMINFEIDLLR